ncbi:hypothetical protein [Streptomyces sp. KL110A]|uniref:hypothetical protein n=1 Tax=Streptomyces sp. KL110A TaxID=3384221 RepID=UPI0038BF9F71
MSRTARITRTPRTRGLATAVALVLAVTAGGVSAAPAMAVPAATGPTATADLPEREPVSMPTGSTLRGGGPSGFLSVDARQDRFSWTRYADGSPSSCPRACTGAPSAATSS